MLDPSEHIQVSQGAVLRDATSSIIKSGGPAEVKLQASGSHKMSLQDYQNHKSSQIRLYDDE